MSLAGEAETPTPRAAYKGSMNELHLRYLASPEWAAQLRADLLPWMDRVADLGDDVLEIGPGPGLTTDLLRDRAARVTAVELDPALAAALAERLAGANVDVVEADAADTGLPSGRFSAATCFSMLHHVPTAAAQDRVLAEIARLLRPGAALFATDAVDHEALRAFHEDDTFNPVDLDSLGERLRAAGFAAFEIEADELQVRFVARTLL
jgi:SAM-dependent methyltransferase